MKNIELQSGYETMLDNHGGRSVKFVSLPLPPCPAHNKIYMPDAFTSKSFDGIPTFTSDSNELHVLRCKRTEFGPAILAITKLSDLIHFDGHYIHAHKNAICATVSYRNFVTENQIDIVDDVSLERISFGGGSCHPGSHLVVPKAPHLTALMQWQKAPRNNEYQELSEVITYMDPLMCEMEFEGVDFSENEKIDALISHCIVEPSVSAYNVIGGLGEWAAPILKSLRNNALRKENCYEFVTSKGEILLNSRQDLGQRLAENANSSPAYGLV